MLIKNNGMEKFLEEIAPVLSAVFSAGGLLSLFFARKERKAAAAIKEASAVEIMQKIYTRLWPIPI